MKRQTARWVKKAEDDYRGARQLARAKEPLKDLICFHCQQSAEKYLKALLQEKGLSVPKTHDLDDLLQMLLPDDASLAPLQRGLHVLTQYGVDYRYPGATASLR